MQIATAAAGCNSVHVVTVGVLSVGACCASVQVLYLQVSSKVATVFLCIYFVPVAAGGNAVHMLQRSVHML